MFTHNFVVPPKMSSVTDDDGTRHYLTPNGDRYESTTTFLGRLWDKEFLEKWYKRLGEVRANSESKRARDRGHLLHKAVEAYLLNDEGYRKLLASHILTKGLFLKVKPALNRLSNLRIIEKPIYSDELKLAGTPDIIADFDGELATVDLKGSGKDKKEEWITTYWLQTAIYSRMYQERFGEMPSKSVIIMAVEDNPQPAVFVESTYKGQQRLDTFLEDPMKFQEDLKREQAKNRG